jgi:DNA ligase D-like protein (predicted ligase)
MYARTVQNLPEGPEWQYEIKLDGYRCLAARDENGATLWSRRRTLFTNQFPDIARACRALKHDTLLDGEIVALDKNGQISFNLLQNNRSQASALHYYVFDLMIYRSKSLLEVPLGTRRELLRELLQGLDSETDVRLAEALEAEPVDLIAAAKQLGFEGIVAKRKDSSYEPGKRSGAWVKYRINRAQEFVIGGYTPGHPLDAVIVGYYDENRLICVGKVRNGFVPHLRREVASRLRGLRTATCPFANLPERKRTQWALTREEMKNCVWLRPELVAQIEFTEWTPDNHLRQSKFISLRDDKDPRDIRREQ